MHTLKQNWFISKFSRSLTIETWQAQINERRSVSNYKMDFSKCFHINIQTNNFGFVLNWIHEKDVTYILKSGKIILKSDEKLSVNMSAASFSVRTYFKSTSLCSLMFLMWLILNVKFLLRLETRGFFVREIAVELTLNMSEGKRPFWVSKNEFFPASSKKSLLKQTIYFAQTCNIIYSPSAELGMIVD